MGLLKFVLLSVTGYAAVVGALLALQRRMIYFPSKSYTLTPADAGLPWEEVFLKAVDGVKLCAWYVPADKDGSPVVLYFHGNATNLSGLVGLAGEFRGLGFGFFAVDYRGYGKSEGTPTESGLYADARAAYGWLVDRGVKPGRIFIYGQSLGAAVAARLVSEQRAAGVILEGAFPSIYAAARHHYFWAFVPRAAVKDRFETEEYVARSLSPVLVIHGARDSIAPRKFGEIVFAAAREPKVLCIVPDSSHNTISPASPAVRKALAGFRDRCLNEMNR